MDGHSSLALGCRWKLVIRLFPSGLQMCFSQSDRASGYDSNDSATFVVFDREMTKLTKKDAPTLALEENSGVGRHELPRCLEKLDGKDYFFQIRFTPYNFTPKPLYLNRLYNHNQTTVVDSEGGQATASASNTVVTAKIATGVKEPNPSNGS
ncbi:hypothetical protein HID58_055585 [Brassica napus]|uniref:Uncharacterized protein n=1 Tax=Brassica napus TaxID=3708 RepID=A0ABQ8AKR6_BRANA|nr:hypothetical protein HID58_055585 [Brassica napus]